MNSTRPTHRRRCIVQGIVQGVGFRPFVHRVAIDLGLTGFVRNQSGEVYLEVEGTTEALDRFAVALSTDLPNLARVDSIRWQPIASTGSPEFRIVPSSSKSSSQIFIAPDVATCADCLTELFDPTDRRFHYPFLNCTNCGPRLTIICEAPYDRQRTTMATFAMCAQCQREYDDPADRRFHAQPIACPQCGPHLRLLSKTGGPIETDNPLGHFVTAILSGQIGSMKGLGGYQLVCDACSDSAVAELRRRKHRDQKPFAIMVGSVEQAMRYCEIDAAESALLCSHRRPIVLLRTRRDAEAATVAGAVAPDNQYLGVMLPYTPLHHLLFDGMNGQPLVMTSGNRADEPIAYDDNEAIERLGEIVDLVLTHNRPIHVRCDDSVTRSIDGRESLLRRSRGYAPEPLTLPVSLARSTLAVGGQLKATFALGRERLAFLSHHLGDLDHFAAYQAFERDIGLYEGLFDVRSELTTWHRLPACDSDATRSRQTRLLVEMQHERVDTGDSHETGESQGGCLPYVDLIVHDLHPNYASTGYAQRRAATQGLRLLAVQHHHAHVASCMAENGLSGPVIGVAFDGTGYGTDGAIWGGEFLVATYSDFQRVGHLRYVGLPGGDTAIREPWRIAVAHLLDAECPLSLLPESVPLPAIRTVEQMLTRKFNSPMTSSIGRLFDAVAAIVGVRSHVSYEGQAAVELELLATDVAPDTSYPFHLADCNTGTDHPRFVIDTRPLIQGVVRDVTDKVSFCLIARRFHSTIVDIISAGCQNAQRSSNLEQVVLTGGVFMNALLLRQAVKRLTGDGFQVYRHVAVPCNDGGLSLGQLAVAAACDCEPDRNMRL